MSKFVRSPEGQERQRIKSKKYAARKRKEDSRYRVRQLLYQSQARARKKNLEHTITEQDLINLWPFNNKCPIFGITLEWNDRGFRETSPSIDRIDNSKGYTLDNIQIISFKANWIKGHATLEDLETLVNYLKALGE